jgi:hypothetical protein
MIDIAFGRDAAEAIRNHPGQPYLRSDMDPVHDDAFVQECSGLNADPTSNDRPFDLGIHDLASFSDH